MILDTTNKIVRYLEGLSYFIDEVRITKVENWSFTFRVKLPLWFKFLLGWFVRMEIERKLKQRIPAGITFKFELYSTHLF